MGETTFWDVVDGLREREDAYAREAYGFVVGALGATVQQLPVERLDDPQRRHLSGRELLLGVVSLARSEFGPLAATVFHEWGVRHCEDIGHIVFQLVACGQLSARAEDTMTDFSNEFDLLSALSDDTDPGCAPRSVPPRNTH